MVKFESYLLISCEKLNNCIVSRVHDHDYKLGFDLDDQHKRDVIEIKSFSYPFPLTPHPNHPLHPSLIPSHPIPPSERAAVLIPKPGHFLALTPQSKNPCLVITKTKALTTIQ